MTPKVWLALGANFSTGSFRGVVKRENARSRAEPMAIPVKA